ncbi:MULTISPECIES: 2,3-butanediol dehydrogenase [Rhizobium/Agrobacterium group]|uniref:2,3-butanediol dehydrogenase n=1 Tax=Rhizobium/Agrobacterium group TaxID=227290 RepID=UPI0015724D78|nr:MULTISPECIES: 2,3-butanediol dehydrogenase [Rhizobium/Agrobacterium group]NTD86791.1 2,3-butanediol dehydrogenase [Agrobacterium tumefaciens]NTD91518.1 2,3-butanediol dehydrogenase [Agrobacterium tumefaciens]NTD96988.1 2,3-butanediol dehydrogenase [Agrobacterium tumefaciens]NTE11890.1 2,3-butanediol dehydrogenase [Agrobacterium tumefaciens]NTE24787.1 2,3-butanediol dehydrogenase [Agrobacterium tumefaciens]
MRAVRLYDKHDVRVDRIPEPTEIGHGQVLVGPTLCGICGTDLHEYESGPIFTPKTANPHGGAVLPQILGHEFAARVVAVGDGVESVKPGDRVSIQPQIGPRYDYFGRRNLSFLGPKASVVGLSWPWGGMAERAVVNEYNTVRMPDEITDQQGALTEPAAVAVHAIDRAGVQPGSCILITGAGPIGALMVLAAQAAGATRIFVSEPNPNRRKRLSQISSQAILLDPTKPGFLDEIRNNTEEGVGVDAAIECAGNPRALNACIQAVRAQGIVVQVGLMGVKAEIDPFDLTMRDITLRGSLNYPLTIWPRIFEMMRMGVLAAEKIIDDEISLEDVVERGFKKLLDPASGKLKILVSAKSY